MDGERICPEPPFKVPALTTRMHVLWTANRSPLHRKLSFNVLREICSYIGDMQKVIAVLEDHVKFFNVATSEWQQLSALRSKIQVDFWTSSTYIAPNRIISCGGGWSQGSTCSCHIGNSAYVLEGDGSVQELPRMSIGRRWPGIAWDSSRETLYVFGGDDGRSTCYPDYLHTSEMFLSQWSPLPDMHQARSCFNPCWHYSLLYLCGGGFNSVETYDPRSNTFTLHDFTLPDAYSSTIAVVESGVITIISQHHISKLQEGKITSQQHEPHCPWSSCTPLVSGGVVYTSYYGACYCIDLITGEMLKDIR